MSGQVYSKEDVQKMLRAARRRAQIEAEQQAAELIEPLLLKQQAQHERHRRAERQRTRREPERRGWSLSGVLSTLFMAGAVLIMIAVAVVYFADAYGYKIPFLPPPQLAVSTVGPAAATTAPRPTSAPSGADTTAPRNTGNGAPIKQPWEQPGADVSTITQPAPTVAPTVPPTAAPTVAPTADVSDPAQVYELANNMDLASAPVTANEPADPAVYNAQLELPTVESTVEYNADNEPVVKFQPVSPYNENDVAAKMTMVKALDNSGQKEQADKLYAEIVAGCASDPENPCNVDLTR